MLLLEAWVRHVCAEHKSLATIAVLSLCRDLDVTACDLPGGERSGPSTRR